VSAAPESLRRTLAELVAIDSTSTRSNLPVVEILERRLQAMGFACERHRYAGEDGQEKVNLLGQRGAGPVHLALVGHTDCVPFDPAWKEALTLTERDSKLYGRGACDTKAFVACALVALERVPAASLSRTVGVRFTADEEMGCLGAKKLLDAGKGGAKYAVIGEPTSLRPIRANKGYCLAEVEVLGKEGHSAYPESGASAIFRSARLLHRLERWAATELEADVDLAFEPPFTTVNVGTISGGRAKNVIPGSCRWVVEWRPIPQQPVSLVGEKLLELVAELKRDDPGFEAHVRVTRSDRGVDTPASAELVQFLARESGQAPGTVAFGTEAPQLTALGAQSVVFGPGDIRVAHRTGEFVPIPELVRCEEILERALLQFCSG
jgi:acetylornithine deacetylase